MEMNKTELINTIEKVNRDYLELFNSEQRRVGDAVLRAKKIIKNKDFKKAYNFLKYRKTQKIINHLSSPVSYDDIWYYTAEPREDVKGCVYSCITGGYDKPRQPQFADGQRFVLFSDAIQNDTDLVWELHGLDAVPKTLNGADINRYCKLHPFELFSRCDLDYALYIDGNVQVISDVSSLYNVAHSAKSGIAMHKHWARDCIYNEAVVCCETGKGNRNNIKKQIKKYKHFGFPQHFGMFEASIIMVDLKNMNAQRILDNWWKEFKRSESGRDQLAFPYVLWRMGFKPDDIGLLGNNLFYNPKFRNVDFGRHDGMEM